MARIGTETCTFHSLNKNNLITMITKKGNCKKRKTENNNEKSQTNKGKGKEKEEKKEKVLPLSRSY